MIFYKRWKYYILSGVAAIFLCLLLLVTTTPGLKLFIKILNRVDGIHLQAEKIEGRLISTITLQNLDYEDPLLKISAKSLTITWRPFALFKGVLRIKSITGNQGTIVFDEDFIKNLVETSMPLRLVINNLDLKNVTFSALNQPNKYIQHILWEGKSSSDIFTITKFDITSHFYQYTSTGDVGWEEPRPINYQFQFKSLNSRLVQGSGNIRGSFEDMKIKAALTRPSSVKVQANFTLKKLPSLILKAEWEKGQWPLQRPQYFSKSGHLNLQGNINQFTTNVETDIYNTNLPQTTITINTDANESQIKTHARVKALEGQINLNHTVTRQDNYPWSLDMDINKINPGFMITGSPGHISAKLNAKGRYQDRLFIDALSLPSLTGSLNNTTINGRLNYQKTNEGFQFSPSFIRIGQNYFDIQGGHDKNWHMQTAANLPSLESINQSLKGAITFKASLNDSYRDPTFSLKANASNLRYRFIKMDNVTASVQGHQENHQLNLLLVNKGQTANIKGQIKITPEQIDVMINQWNYNGKQAGQWELQKSWHSVFTRDKWIIEPNCWRSGKQQLCIALNKNGKKKWESHLQVISMNTNNFDFLLPENLTLSSELNIESSLSIIDGQAKGKGTLSLTPGKLSYLYEEVERYTPFKTVNFNYAFDDKGAMTSGTIKLSNHNEAQMNIELPFYQTHRPLQANQPIKASAHLDFSKLDWIEAVIPEFSEISGKLLMSVNVNGTVSVPKIEGNLSLNNGHVTVPYLETALENISANFNAAGKNTVEVNIKGKAGDGELQIKGNTKFNHLRWLGKYELSGKDALIMNTSEYKITTSPSLTFNSENTHVTINGNILVPYAQIQPTDFSNTLELPEEDIIYLGIETTAPTFPLQIDGKVKLISGEKIYLNYSGLEGYVDGDITCKLFPDSPTLANGQLKIINGKYKAYSRVLTVDSGMLFFADTPLLNPGVNLRASRTLRVSSNLLASSPTLSSGFIVPAQTSLSSHLQIATIKVGLLVTGTLDEPKLSLFSEPATIPQSDILSYLILGHALGQTSQSGSTNIEDSTLLFDALSTLNLGGTRTSQITKQIEHAFGLDKLELTKTTTPDPKGGTPVENTAIILGKSITSRLYVDYTFGLLQALNILRINYQLTPNWSIQSQNSENANSIDILYTVNRN